ncbi:hypothetical protein BT96DRAFT_169923 [Gymnopus androsaceus JB14]|uniref:Uncharacterized protein n=1 Tax=Gymnopus androsaceus JB14 TaxID=1447944 RepID=A0A6A4HCT9_9AGAR|nr:hypothetical protein BT96DRAFT_169923 [Gymnopus androsaceus JB14]
MLPPFTLRVHLYNLDYTEAEERLRWTKKDYPSRAGATGACSEPSPLPDSRTYKKKDVRYADTIRNIGSITMNQDQKEIFQLFDQFEKSRFSDPDFCLENCSILLGRDLSWVGKAHALDCFAFALWRIGRLDEARFITEEVISMVKPGDDDENDENRPWYDCVRQNMTFLLQLLDGKSHLSFSVKPCDKDSGSSGDELKFYDSGSETSEETSEEGSSMFIPVHS